LSAKVIKSHVDLVLDVVVHRAGNQDAARLGNAFQASRDIDPITIEVATLDHDIAEGSQCAVRSACFPAAPMPSDYHHDRRNGGSVQRSFGRW
jgi:hypothetical protein